jgi:hypothetical protein
MVGILALGFGVSLLFVAGRFQVGTLLSYLAIALAITLNNSLRQPRSRIFSHFRVADDWIEEQVFARSIVETRSLKNPFLFGEKMTYHWGSQWYWGSFEHLAGSDTYAFSGPSLLACSILAAVVLLVSSVNGGQSEFGSSRIITGLVIAGSWPFTDNFTWDQFSRSQSLGLAIGALFVFVVYVPTRRVTHLLVPTLATAGFITKVSVGLLLCILTGLVTLVRLWSLTSNRKYSTQLWMRELLREATAPLIAAIAVGSAYYTTFVAPSTTLTHGRLLIQWRSPNIYYSPHGIVNFLQLATVVVFAVSPLLISVLKRNPLRPIRPDENSWVIPLACLLMVIIGSFLSSESGIPFNMYTFGLAWAVLAPTIITQLFVHVKKPLNAILVSSGVVLSAIPFMILERLQPRYFDAEAVGLIVFFLGVATIAIGIRNRSLAAGLLVALAIVACGNSIGNILGPWSSGINQLNTVSAEYDEEFQKFAGVTSYLHTLRPGSVFAVEYFDGVPDINVPVNLIAGSANLQRWADPNYSRDNASRTSAARTRLPLQYALLSNPSDYVVKLATQRGVTHVLLTSTSNRQRWSSWLKERADGTQETQVFVTYRDAVAEVLALVRS